MRKPGISAYEKANLWSRISFSWVGSLISKGWYRLQLEQDDAAFLIPHDIDAQPLSDAFEATYSKLKAKYTHMTKPPNITTLTLFRLYWPVLLYHSLWVLCEVAVRLLSPLALRYFLSWIQSDQLHPGSSPAWVGWLLALAVAAGGVGMTLIHHQFFWIGMRMGFTMRQQVVAAIHAKVLRLNSAAVAHANSGTIINLASNDVRRFDEGFSFWLFCWAGPLEAALVLLMVSLELGFVPAICGMAAMLAVIPMQALLVRTIAGLRRNTAAHTDERVSLTGEVIQGCLAMKMLGWEEPFARSICGIRKEEVSYSGRMAQIRGLNITLQFCMTPVVAFVTFATYRAYGAQLNLPSVFYALSLLRLPQLYLVYFAVIGFQYMTETFIAVQRIDKFLSMPEPPPPVHMWAKTAAAAAAAAAPTPQATTAAAAAAPTPQATTAAAAAAAPTPQATTAAAAAAAAAAPTPQATTAVLSAQISNTNAAVHTIGKQQENTTAAAEQPTGVTLSDHPNGYVELGGADYDWATNVEEMAAQDVSSSLPRRHRGLVTPAPLQQQSAVAAAPGDPQPSTPTPTPAAAAAAALARAHSVATSATSRSSTEGLPTATRKTLSRVQLIIPPGELLAVVGEVGSGKSSLLAALLGELMPLRAADGQVHGGPVVVGRVAYCSQVPWIMAATLRDNILFQAPLELERYNKVVASCALQPDLAGLPAGDMTELGERGVNLSGGQKARVALARAAYSAASVVLLDDPLSAVDPRVGRILFDNCIGPQGILAGSTRVLVTHQRQFLPKCDRVAVLRHGELIALGTWNELLPLQLPELVGGAVTMSLDAAEEEDEEESVSEGAEAAVEQQDDRQSQSQQQMATVALVETDPDHDTDVFKSAAAQPFPSSVTAGAAPLSSEKNNSVSNSAGSGNGEVESSESTDLQRVLSRSRTMAPDLNRRPADSGRNPSSSGGSQGFSSSLNPGRSIGNFMRAISGRFNRKEAAGYSSKHEGLNTVGSGGLRQAIGSAQFTLQHSISSLFIPPAYLPPNPYAIPAAAAQKNMQDRFDRQDNRRGLALLGPVRSFLVLTHQGSLKWGSGLSTVPSTAAATNKPADGNRNSSNSDQTANSAADARQLVAAEKRETGSVSWGVYGAYARQVGLPTSLIMFVALVLGQGVYLAADWWLALWSASPPAQQMQLKWLMVYGLLTAGVISVSLMRSALFFWATMRAATRIHNTMLLRVLRAPLAFFHTNPAGRVLNRFSNDQGRVDDMLPMALFDVLQSGFVCLAAFVLVAIAVPFILPVFVALLIAFYYYRQRYITTSREVKRWDATSRSPVYASFSATLKGLPTIRAFGAESHFQDSFISLLSLNGQWWFAYLGTARWIGFRLDLIATITLTMAVLLAMAVRAQVQAAILGLALTYVLQLTGTLQWWTRQTVEVENNMTCVERMVEYTQLPQEPPRLCDGGGAPPKGWPKSGSITYNNVTARYRPGLPPVLLNLSFHLEPGTSCGLVGRTGSGKSSLMLTLFRLIEVNAGSIFLDGVDTASIGLDALRRQLATIPQDPVLFSGTLRSNLDPWNEHDDAVLWHVLSAAQLKAPIRAAGGLHVRMAEAGDNLSVGQRQLFCLARALLQDARVLALDEATANVDRSTDALIQQSLRKFAEGEAGKQSGRVLLVIAHRIDTIMDCDHLLVLSNGVLVEQGRPAQLAAQTCADGSQPVGVFANMVEAAKAAAAGHH